ncbi:hypothetical protein [Marinobacter sp.]|uniref:hypothetical protein n=1 Tax=Marinobacter sp. TaxID=50741 RepID=UPI0034A3317B
MYWNRFSSLVLVLVLVLVLALSFGSKFKFVPILASVGRRLFTNNDELICSICLHHAFDAQYIQKFYTLVAASIKQKSRQDTVNVSEYCVDATKTAKRVVNAIVNFGIHTASFFGIQGSDQK